MIFIIPRGAEGLTKTSLAKTIYLRKRGLANGDAMPLVSGYEGEQACWATVEATCCFAFCALGKDGLDVSHKAEKAG